MQNKLFAILITALLVLAMAGSAMCATYDSNVTLENKVGHPDWDVIDDGFSALIEYNAIGEEFEWRAVGVASMVDTDYVLIYYADKEDRFVNWGGNNPGAHIGNVTTGSDGSFDVEGSTDIGINMPESPDTNMEVYDYCESDGYDTCHGAKLWMVPAAQYDIDNSELTSWTNVNHFLFETDLIWYDDTDYNIPPEIKDAKTDPSCVAAGDTVMVSAEVKDRDGQYDLENMIVTANMSIYGADDNVVLNYTGMKNHIKAYYSANVTVTTSKYGSFDIYAEDPAGANDTLEAYLDVEPGQCAYMELENYYDNNGWRNGGYTDDGDELRTVALTHLWDCNTCPVMWWCDDEMFDIYMLIYSVHIYDEYGNYIGPINEFKCCEEFTATFDEGSAASMKYSGNRWWYNNKIVIVNELIPGESTLTVHCVGDNIPDLVQVIEFLNPISSLEVTADVDEIYAPNRCNDEDNLNVTAQILDPFGNDIPMPRVPVMLYIDREGQETVSGESYTDDNGTAIFDITLETTESGTVVSFRAEAECRKGSMTLGVVDPVLSYVEIVDTWSPMESGDDQTFVCVGYTDHDTMMCCPCDGIWTATFGEINNTTGYFVAGEYEGVAEITVDVSGVVGTVDIVIDADGVCVGMGEGATDCPIPGVEFTLTSGTVSITGNYSGDNGYACVQAMGAYDPGCDNATKYAWVYTNENVTLDLNGTGDMYRYNRTSEAWEFYATGDTADTDVTVEPDTWYALVTEAEPEPEPDPEPTPTATVTRRGGGGGGTYPPDPVPTPTPNATDNETDQDDPKPATAKAADAKPTVNLPGGDTTLDTTPDDEDEAPGGADPTNAIFIVLGILALLVIGYVLYRKSQNGE